MTAIATISVKLISNDTSVKPKRWHRSKVRALLLIYGDQMSYLTETTFTNAADDDQLFRTSKRAISPSVFDDARGKSRADARQRFEFVLGRRVYVDARGVRLIERRGSCRTQLG